ncbi:DNA-directed RNA polymerase subunit beta [Mycoplasma haemofelis Ohio2]|uniref:DNA-directed RNA polymerase subunit beta n=1 Tax=Mycoplasma haemofelis (strain Ohio2) TaxID=859194 RepID=F6FHE4_MYCHI|nr:DNA-directed RNA polymerase subunit beta [Mycoplasma haemofelis Ohio2]
MSRVGYPINSFSPIVNRLDFSKVKSPNFVPPDLKGVQLGAYAKFVNGGLESLLKSFFPIYSHSKSTALHLEEVVLVPPEISEHEALEKGKSYQYAVRLVMKLVSQYFKDNEKSKTDNVFLGNLPALTARSNYIINGIEKFIISQIVRAPGAYMLSKSQIKLSSSKKRVQEGFICELLPLRGILMLFNYQKDRIKVTAKNNVGTDVIQFPLTTLLKALGFSEKNILDIFESAGHIVNTLSDEDYRPKDMILSEGPFMKWFENTVVNQKDHEKWLEDSKESVFKTLNSLSYQYYDKHWRGSHENIIGKLRMAAAANSTEDYEITKASLEKEIGKSHDLLEAISVEWAAYHLVQDIGISPDISPYKVSSFQELLWVYFFGKNYYDVGKSGRYKLDHKLSLSQRIFQKVLAQDVLSTDGEVVFPKGTYMTREKVFLFDDLSRQGKLKIRNSIDIDYVPKTFPNYELHSKVEVESILIHQTQTTDSPVLRIVGTPRKISVDNNLFFSDFVAIVSYITNLGNQVGKYDDIDHLGNKRLKLVDQLLSARIQVAMARIVKFSTERMNSMEARINYATLRDSSDQDFTVKTMVNTKFFQSVIKEFFNSHQLTQFLDQQNPLSELTNKRKISAMGPGGIKREDPNLNIRDVHYSHYGKICPIETPEGMNIGLIMALAFFAQIDEYGFFVTPYYKVKDGKVTDQVEWLSALKEEDFILSEAHVPRDEDGNLQGNITVRYKDSVESMDPKLVDYVDVACNQLVSISASLIPFLEHNDANRALMGSNMQRQAVPLLKPYSPVVGTGVEYKIASDSGLSVLSKGDGQVTSVDGNSVSVKYDDPALGSEEVSLYKFERSNQNTCKNQYPLVKPGQRVKVKDVLANGSAMQNGELALGQNVLVAFTTWFGYNYEDAIILSSRLIEEDVYTSVHIQEHTIECMRTKIGDDEITRQIPNTNDHEKRYLDEDGIIMVGAEVKEGDILVGKVSPLANTEQTSEEKLLQAIFSEKVKSVKDSSLRVPTGGAGVVTRIMRLSIYKGDKLDDDVIEVVKVFITQKRKIQVGDKMAGRHGNKGIISKIALREDMPYLEDGTPVDIVLNPLGVPSRMNIGQVLETHLGYAARRLSFKKLLEFKFNKDKESARSLFGLDENAVDKLFGVVEDYLSEKKISSYEEAKALKNIDFSIVLSKAGLKEDDLNIKVSTPIFCGVNNEDLVKIMQDADIDPSLSNGKFTLIDGKTGEKFPKPITCGIIYMLKLDHMVDDKIYARSVGPYSKITQQPLGGKCQNGGQRFGEMEVWALEAYGAAYNLRELLTIKSDDIQSRSFIFSSIIKRQPLPTPNIPESFKLLVKKLEGACLKINVQYGDENKFISCSEFIEKQLSREVDKESLFTSSSNLKDR